MKKQLVTCLSAVFSLFAVSTAYAAIAQVSSNPMVAKTILTRGEDSMKMSIEKMKSALASSPFRTGIDLTPSLTEDRRKELSKILHKLSEDFRVAVRNERRHAAENIKTAEKDKKITEEEREKAEEELQKLTDAYMKKIDGLLAAKDKEIMDV